MSNDKKKSEENQAKKEKKGKEAPDPEREHIYEDWDELAGESEAEADPSRLRRLEGLMPDILKRSFVSGIGSVFMSEDGIRSMVADTKLPKEAVSYLVAQADSTKRDFFRIVSREIREFLENMDFGGELTKILTSVSFEIKTEVRFIPNDSAPKPSIRNRVAVRRADGGEDVFEDDGFGEGNAGGEDEPRKRSRWSLRRNNGNATGEEEDED
ncbi:MAG: hypothetical protein ACNA8W_25460 [Bradymonadaceae bacterium]